MSLENVSSLGFDMVSFTQRDRNDFTSDVILTRAEILQLLDESNKRHVASCEVSANRASLVEQLAGLEESYGRIIGHNRAARMHDEIVRVRAAIAATEPEPVASVAYDESDPIYMHVAAVFRASYAGHAYSSLNDRQTRPAKREPVASYAYGGPQTHPIQTPGEATLDDYLRILHA